MMCEICGKEEGRIKYTKVINGEKVEFYICEGCARNKGFISPGTSLKKDKESEENVKILQDSECPLCGWKLVDVEKKGKLGCPNCYRTFRTYVSSIVGELHGRGKHRGKIPILDERKLLLKKKIREAKKGLDDAIKKEEYELAAELRDKIKTLSVQIKKDE